MVKEQRNIRIGSGFPFNKLGTNFSTSKLQVQH